MCLGHLDERFLFSHVFWHAPALLLPFSHVSQYLRTTFVLNVQWQL